jgi:hypothetical protein
MHYKVSKCKKLLSVKMTLKIQRRILYSAELSIETLGLKYKYPILKSGLCYCFLFCKN